MTDSAQPDALSDQVAEGVAGVPPKDPFAGIRGIMAGIHILEVIVVILALPIVIQFGRVSAASIVYLGVLTAVFIVGAGIQRRSWSLFYNLGAQLLLVAGYFVHESIGIMGVIFLMVWIYVLYVQAQVRKKWQRGELPAQKTAAAQD